MDLKMKEYFLVVIEINSCEDPTKVVTDAWKAAQGGIQKKSGKKVFAFKVIGENRLVLVIHGDPEDILEEINTTCGSKVRVSSIPLRAYEDFAEKILKVEDKTLTVPSEYNLGKDGQFYWLHLKVEYQGKQLDEFMATLRREAEAALGFSKHFGGLELFKVLAQREVYAFVKASDANTMDDISFTLPLMKEMGSHVHIITRAVRHLE